MWCDSCFKKLGAIIIESDKASRRETRRPPYAVSVTQSLCVTQSGAQATMMDDENV